MQPAKYTGPCAGRVQGEAARGHGEATAPSSVCHQRLHPAALLQSAHSQESDQEPCSLRATGTYGHINLNNSLQFNTTL